VKHRDYQSCWILLEGTAIFGFRSGEDSVREFVETGGVLHFRGGAVQKLGLQVIEDARLLEVVYCEHECCCG
jgi:hypothetical protein